MQEQQINFYHHSPQSLLQQYQNHHLYSQQSHKNHTLSANQIKAKKRLKFLHRYLPNSFITRNPLLKPHNNIYRNQNLTASLILCTGSPLFATNSLLYDRQRLQIQRQMMYCRAALNKQTIDQQLVEMLITESAQRRGFINKEGNKSVIVGGSLVYVDRVSVKAIRLPEYLIFENENTQALQVFKQSLNPITIYSFDEGTRILQLRLLPMASFSNQQREEEVLVWIRLPREILALSLSSKLIIYRKESSHEQQFVCLQTNNYFQHTYQTVLYDGNDSIIQKHYFPSNSNLHYQLDQDLLKIKDDLINSINTIDRNQTIFSTERTLQSHDCRTNNPTVLYHVNGLNKPNQPNDTSIYASLKVTGNFSYGPYLVSCHTRQICLFDVRNPSQPVERRLHHCQESPPELMTYFDGLEHKVHRPILLCRNPYGKPSAIMNQIDFDDSVTFFNEQQGSQWSNSGVFGQHFEVVSSEGYINQPIVSTYQNSYSLSVCNYSPQLVALFETGNEGRVKVNFYNYNKYQGKYKPKPIFVQQPTLKQLQKSHLKSTHEKPYSQIWLKSHLSQKYLSQKVSKFKNTNKSKNSSKCKKYRKQQQKKHKTNQKIHWDQQNSATKDILFESDQYSHQQQCQQSYSRRKLNFSDFSQFYKTLQAKAQKITNKSIDLQHNLKQINLQQIPKFIDLQPISKLNGFNSSFVSTQSSSNEILSLSQQYSIDSIDLQNLNLQDQLKYTLKPSSINRFKNSWNSQ